MARLTRPRRDVAVTLDLDGSAGHSRFGHDAVAPRDGPDARSQRNGKDSEKKRAIPGHKCGRL